jgi:hypothetical protein
MAKQLQFTEQECIRILNLVISCISLQDDLSELNKDVLLFNPQIARNARTLLKSMDYINHKIGSELFNADMAALEAAIEHRTNLLRNIAGIRPEDWQLLDYASKWITDSESKEYQQLLEMCKNYEDGTK